MPANLPHYSDGVASRQVAVLIFGGQMVMPNTFAYGSTDLTVNLASNASAAVASRAIGVAGGDGNVMVTQAATPNSYGQPLIDISVLPDYIPVYFGHQFDIGVFYGPSVNVYEGQLLVINSVYGTVGPYTDQGSTYSQTAGDAGLIVARCTEPGGVAAAMCTQQIGGGNGGGGASTYYFGRCRLVL